MKAIDNDYGWIFIYTRAFFGALFIILAFGMPKSLKPKDAFENRLLQEAPFFYMTLQEHKMNLELEAKLYK